jgi:hypothetical protein
MPVASDVTQQGSEVRSINKSLSALGSDVIFFYVFAPSQYNKHEIFNIMGSYRGLSRKKEANPEEIKCVVEHQEVPKEKAVV